MIRRLKTAVTMQRSATIPYVPHLTLLTNIDINIAERNEYCFSNVRVCVCAFVCAKTEKKTIDRKYT